MAMSLESRPLTHTITIDGTTYHGSEDWGDDGLVKVMFTDGEWSVSSGLFEPADLAFAWDQAEHALRFHAANRARQLVLI
jgi:hypothetical protein